MSRIVRAGKWQVNRRIKALSKSRKSRRRGRALADARATDMAWWASVCSVARPWGRAGTWGQATQASW